MTITTTNVFTAVMLWCCVASAQQSGNDQILEQLERTGQVELRSSNVLIMKSDYKFEGDNVEALEFRPIAEGRYPGLVLIPGYSKTARDYIPLGVRFAKAGYACMAITQPGFGHSEGEPDFVGPTTISTLEAGIKEFRSKPFVDPARLGVFGYSRGAMAASQLAIRLDELKAAVLAAGIYDFQKAYDEIQIDEIKKNMEREAGVSPEAIDERSSIRRMSQLKCPVLILHGELDKNAPISQATALRDKLNQENKEHDIVIFPGEAHSIGMKNLLDATLPFLEKHLRGPDNGPPK
jgi:dipeptidyl aminopeptidase/acylaminoacyl peptidase